MSVQVQRANQPSKMLEIAKFTHETLLTATQTGKTFVCGWTSDRRVDMSTRILIQARLGDASYIIGDGEARSAPRTNDDRFGDGFPYTVRLTDVRIISDPANFLPPVIEGQGAFIADAPGKPTFDRAAGRVIQLDRMELDGLTTDDIKVIKTWDFE